MCALWDHTPMLIDLDVGAFRLEFLHALETAFIGAESHEHTVETL